MTEQILEFASELGQAEELTFPPDSAFGKYRPLLAHAVSHPAKMSTGLCEYLINTYTKKGDTIVDCFAGAGTTLIVGALLGRNTIGVELEGHFVKFIEKAIFLLDNTLGEHGKAEIHQGDSRKLSEILGYSDCVITSPPFSNSLAFLSESAPKYASGYHKEDKRNPNKPNISTFPAFEYGDNPQNIGNLKHGSIDAVITSPPYSEAETRDKRKIQQGSISDVMTRSYVQSKHSDPSNISNLKHGSIDAVLGVDTVITSPPYENTGLAGGDAEKRKERLIKAGYGPATLRDMLHDGSQAHRTDYLGGKARNTGLSGYSADAVITSPPYEGMNSNNGEGGRALFEKIAKQPGSNRFNRKTVPPSTIIAQYGESDNQIGNKKGDSYLSAVFQVYQECWKILKPGGLCIVVVKPFQRNGQIVDLPYQTWLLLQKAGFELKEVKKYRLNALSFWRILAYRRDTKIPQLWHEWVLICKKPRGEFQATLEVS